VAGISDPTYPTWDNARRTLCGRSVASSGLWRVILAGTIHRIIFRMLHNKKSSFQSLLSLSRTAFIRVLQLRLMQPNPRYCCPNFSLPSWDVVLFMETGMKQFHQCLWTVKENGADFEFYNTIFSFIAVPSSLALFIPGDNA